MDDLIPFLIFIVIAAINFIKYLSEKGGRPSPAKPQQEKPERKPSALEDIFKEITQQFEPKPHPMPDWPEEIERPDYLGEMEAYASRQPEPVPATQPAVTDYPEASAPAMVLKTKVPRAKALAKSAPMKLAGMGTGLTGLGHVRISSPTLLRSATGSTRFELNSRKQLKQALIANMVFGAPRAYDTTFENTMNI